MCQTFALPRGRPQKQTRKRDSTPLAYRVAQAKSTRALILFPAYPCGLFPVPCSLLLSLRTAHPTPGTHAASTLQPPAPQPRTTSPAGPASATPLAAPQPQHRAADQKQRHIRPHLRRQLHPFRLGQRHPQLALQPKQRRRRVRRPRAQPALHRQLLFNVDLHLGRHAHPLERRSTIFHAVLRSSAGTCGWFVVSVIRDSPGVGCPMSGRLFACWWAEMWVQPRPSPSHAAPASDTASPARETHPPAPAQSPAPG
jgi:hypothetical protein